MLRASFSALGLAAGTARAAPAPAPAFHHHWCPGDRWDRGWGNNWDWGHCRDWDDNNFGEDDYVAPRAWAPPAPPAPFWAPWAAPAWNPGVNAWGYWNNGIWIQL
jgi:hypothetical protein